MKVVTPIRSRRNLRTFVAALLTYLMLAGQVAPLALAAARPNSAAPPTATAKSEAPAPPSSEAPVAQPAPAPLAAPALVLNAPNVTATLDDGVPLATAVAPGGTIHYTANVSNATGTADATTVQFNDTVDTHTTVTGNVLAGPLAISHSYNTAGNTQVKVTDAASGLLSGVHDLDGVTPDANLAVTVVTGGSTSDGGKVDINADGTFTYTPVIGHHDVTDTFNYTVTDGDGLTGTGKVSISVGAVVWYLDVTNNGATDGSDAHPFKTFSQVTGANGPDVAGDIFFVKNTGTYDGNMTLLNNQQLYGSGATLTVNGVTINTASTNTTIGTTTAATNSITLGSGNTVKGFTITNTTGAKIFGSAFGTLTLSNVTLSGSGQALDLTNGTLAATFDNIASTSSASTKPGINLNTVGGSLVVSGATNISGSNTQGINLSACSATVNFGSTTVSSTGAQGINVAGSTGALTFGTTSVSSTATQAILIGTTTNDVIFGATTVTGGNSDGVSFQNNSNPGHSITFASLSITNNTGEGFVHGAGGGTVNVTGATTITHPGSTGIDISGSNANITFTGGVGIDKSTNGGTGVSITGTNTGHTFNFGSLSITTSNGTALSINSTGGTVATSGGTISATGGSAINAIGVTTAFAFNAGSTLASASASGGGVSGITLTNVSGSMSVGGGTLTGNATLPTFVVSGGTVAFTYSGNVTQAANNAAVSISGGHATGTITFNTGTISATNGTGLQFDNADGTYNFNGTTTMNGGDAGIDILNGSGGTFSFNSSTTITNPSGTAFNVATSPGNPTVTYAGTITQSTLNQRVVNVDTTTGGSISFTDSTNGVTGGSTSTGVNINAAAGGVSFAKLTLGTSGSRMVNQAVTITGGSGTFSLGTVSIFTTGAQGIVASNTTGTINSTTGTVDTTLQRAINIAGVSAASKATLGMTLTSVLSTSSSTNGITIQNTLGSFHVVGNAGTCTTGTPTCTGGSIQSTTAEGILLNGAAGIQLAFMKIQSSGTDGIAAATVNGFTLDHSIITDTAGVSGDEGIQFNNVSGTVTVSNSTINGAPHNGIQLTNNNTNLAAFNLTNSTISNNGVGNLVGNDGLLFVTQGTTNVTAATVSGCTFTNILATSLQPQTQDTSTITSFVVTGNTFSHQNMAFDGDVSQASHLTTTIGGPNASDINTFTFTTGPNTINLDSATTSTSGATLTAKVQNNTIGTQGTNDSGGGGIGIRAAIQGATHGVLRIDNNRINEIPNGSGIKIFAVTGTGGANVEITNNTMPKPTGTSIDPGCGNGVRPCPTNTVDLEALNSNSICAIVTGNSAWDPESFTDGAGQSAYFLLQSNPAIFNLEGTGSAATYIAAHNTVTNSSGGTPDVQVFGTVNTVATGTCGSFPAAPVIGSINTPSDAPAPTTAPTLTAQAASTDAPASAGMPASLSESLAEVASPGARATSVDGVPELSGAKRSEGSALRHSARDSSAPLAAQPFAGVRGSAKAATSALANAPAASAAAPFTPVCTSTTSSVQCSFPTLPAGSTVQFKFTATVNNPPALDATDLSGGPHVSTQGHVTADGGINVVTDDPETGAAGDATVTKIDLFGTTVTLNSDNNPSNGGESVTFTANVAPDNQPSTPAVSPTGSVNFIDTSNGNASVCSNVALSAGSAQCVTSTLTAGSTHNIQAVYSGDGNFDPSTSNTVAQQVIACDNPSTVTKTADDGALGSLRYAVAHVCTGGTVNFQIPDADAGHASGVYTITLTGGEIPVGKSMTIVGPNSVVNTDPVVINGGGTTRVFNVSAGTVGISNLTVTDAKVTNGNGAGLLVSGGTVTLTGMLFTANTAVNGGGGGIASVGGTLNVYNSTIDTNTATNGGGVYHDTAGTVAFVNDTITSNTANGDVGAGPVGGGGDSGGVQSLNGVTTTAKNTIIALNSAGTNADQSGVTDSGNNLIGTDPQVNSLANNGGPTKTRSLKVNSPALDAGDNAAANAANLTTDQRGTGFPRIADSADADATATVDIGAFELHPSVEDIPDKSTPEDTPLSFSFNVGDGTLLSSVTATSSNQPLVPDANIQITGSGSSRTIQLTPATNANSTNDGTATITVTVTATNNQTATDTFVLTVTSVNDPPTANADTATAVEAGGVNNGTAGTDITGFNVITGVGTGSVADTDPDTGDTLSIQGVLDGNQGSTVLTGNVGAGISANAPNDYGVLTMHSDGSYNYVVNQTNAIVQGLRTSAQSVDDVFTYTLRDAAGATSNATITIHIQGANDNPVANNDSANATEAGGINNGTAGSNPSGNLLTNDTDVDSAANGETQTVQGVLDGNQGSTVLTGNVGAGISANAPNDYGTLTVAANGNFSYVVNQNNAMVQALNTGGTLDDVFTYTMHDAAGATSNATITIHIQGANDAPTITAGATLAYNENDAATAIDNTITVNDVDNANLSSATVQITGNYQNGQDVLSFTNAGNISAGPFDSTTGTLTLSGSDTLANYQAALRSVKYQNTSDNPSTTARTVSWKVNDGSLDSNIATSTITVAATNDAPTLAANAGLSVSSGGSGTIDNTKLKATDPDNTAAQLVFTVGTAPAHGTLKKSATTLAGGDTFTQADIDGNLISYTNSGDSAAADSFTFTVSDGAGGTIGSTTFNISIAPPTLTALDANASEPSSGSSKMVFTVMLSRQFASTVTVDYATADGTATGGVSCGGSTDYVNTSGTLTFNAGETIKTVEVPICSDGNAGSGAADETLLLNLSNPSNATIANGQATGAIKHTNTPGTFIISEIRTSGPGGLGDDFVELYNNTDSPLTITASDASGGYGLFKMGATCTDSPVLIAQILNGTVIPARGHYLLVGSQYSLSTYATGDQTLTSDIESDRNVALFTTSNVSNISSANRLDAVGFGSNVDAKPVTSDSVSASKRPQASISTDTPAPTGGFCDLFREGTNLPAASGSTLEYSFFRKECDGTPSCGSGFPQDTNDNSADFLFADTQGTPTAMGQRLGAPGPENKVSPINRNSPNNSPISVQLLDSGVSFAGVPNRFRDPTSNTPNATVAPFGTLSIRRRVQNNTGGDVTRLRFRIIEITTFPNSAGNADLRAITSSDVSVSNIHDSTTCVDRTAGTASNCTVKVKGTLLEQPPNQTKGGGYNSSWSVDLSGLSGGKLANGQSVEVQLQLGVVQPGSFRILVIVEALP
jgi:VCBS repeat-containing protein